MQRYEINLNPDGKPVRAIFLSPKLAERLPAVQAMEKEWATSKPKVKKPKYGGVTYQTHTFCNPYFSTERGEVLGVVYPEWVTYSDPNRNSYTEWKVRVEYKIAEARDFDSANRQMEKLVSEIIAYEEAYQKALPKGLSVGQKAVFDAAFMEAWDSRTGQVRTGQAYNRRHFAGCSACGGSGYACQICQGSGTGARIW